jgi:ATP-dependent exoDNAse (exonuclease V) alpha subunit
VFNATEGPDGRRTALDGRALYRHRYTAEAIFQATLRRELATRLGLVFDEIDRHGVAEVAGIDRPMRQAFSRRRAEIVAEMDRIGAHSGRAARAAALTTRKPKPTGLTEADLRAEWNQRAGDLRLDLSNVPRVPRTPTLSVADAELAAALTHEDATFDRRDAIRAVANAARQGAALDEITGRAEQFLVCDQAIPVGEGRWTTPEILELERRVLSIAGGPANDTNRPTLEAIDRAIQARPSLSDEQRTMVTAVCGSGRPIDVVVGRAGSGKTFTLDAVRDAYEASGHRVLGAALAARAARELQAGSGIPATTAHALLAAVDAGRIRLRERDVLVIDEAGMLGTRLMAALVTEAHRAQAKVIVVGDPKQLPEVEAGGLFSALVSRTPATELVENRRQHDRVDRLVTNMLRAGRAELAVRCLDDQGRITVAHNADQLRDRLVADWANHRLAGEDVVMGGVHRSDVRDLNHRAHQLLEAAGELGRLVAEVDEQRFCVGDQVLALKNRYDLGVVNGDLGVITGGDDRAVHIETGDGRRVRLPHDYLDEHLQHGYARTVHKTQGLTCDVALLLGDDTLYAELGYTGLTRGSRENHLYTVVTTDNYQADGYPLEDVIAALDISRAKTPAVDYLDPLDLEAP